MLEFQCCKSLRIQYTKPKYLFSWEYFTQVIHLPDVLTDKVKLLVLLKILHFTSALSSEILFITVKRMTDSMYSLLLYSVNVVLILAPSKESILPRIEALSYVMLIGICPRRVIVQVNTPSSLLGIMEQL